MADSAQLLLLKGGHAQCYSPVSHRDGTTSTSFGVMSTNSTITNAVTILSALNSKIRQYTGLENFVKHKKVLRINLNAVKAQLQVYYCET